MFASNIEKEDRVDMKPVLSINIFCQEKQHFSLWNVVHCVRVEIKQYKPRVHVYCVPKHYGGPWTNKLVAVQDSIPTFRDKSGRNAYHSILLYDILYYSQEKELQPHCFKHVK